MMQFPGVLRWKVVRSCNSPRQNYWQSVVVERPLLIRYRRGFWTNCPTPTGLFVFATYQDAQNWDAWKGVITPAWCQNPQTAPFKSIFIDALPRGTERYERVMLVGG